MQKKFLECKEEYLDCKEEYLECNEYRKRKWCMEHRESNEQLGCV